MCRVRWWRMGPASRTCVCPGGSAVDEDDRSQHHSTGSAQIQKRRLTAFSTTTARMPRSLGPTLAPLTVLIGTMQRVVDPNELGWWRIAYKRTVNSCVQLFKLSWSGSRYDAMSSLSGNPHQHSLQGATSGLETFPTQS